MRFATTVLFLMAACRGDGRAPERTPPSPSAPNPAPAPAPAPEVPAVGSATGGAAPASPPPGTDKVVPVPAEVAAKLELREVVRGLKRPVLITPAPNDARKRLFIVEQRGAIRILEGGKLRDKPFFTISDLSTGNEQGLLGLAFHPQFATNGTLYIHYTARDAATNIVEYKVSASDPDVVDVKSRRPLFRVEQPYSNHNGGHLEIGPDGKLYTGLGDGGAANDPKRNGQNPTSLLSKILRFDLEAAEVKPEIVHRGLRNPWRFAFDRKTGDLFIGDVGQNKWEYIHAVAGGDTAKKNFGWNIVEGSHCFDADTGGGKKSCDKSAFTLPVAEYSHEQGCSITGGIVYRGKALPALDGRYFYADYCTGLLRSFVFKDGVVREHWDWKAALDRKSVLREVSSFGTDHDGELYVVLLSGSIYQIAPKG